MKLQRRMISQSLSRSAKFSKLSPEAASLFCLLIPHFSAHGKLFATPEAIKGIVCPMISWLPLDNIEQLLLEISNCTNVKFWKDENGLGYLQALSWKKYQDLRPDRMGHDRIPDYPHQDVDEDYSCTTPGALQREGEVEVKVEVDMKEKGKEEYQGKGEQGKGTVMIDQSSNNVITDSKQLKDREEKKRSLQAQAQGLF